MVVAEYGRVAVGVFGATGVTGLRVMVGVRLK